MTNLEFIKLAEILNKIQKPTAVKVRFRFLQFVERVSSYKSSLENLKQSYETDELKQIEMSKHEYVSKFKSDEGQEIYGVKVAKEHFNEVVHYILEQNQSEAYIEFADMMSYMGAEVSFDFETFDLNDFPDGVFDDLEVDEIELISYILI